jgi:hypothetical protein
LRNLGTRSTRFIYTEPLANIDMIGKNFKLILLIILSINLTCCEKNPVDFRDSYIGDWQFNVIRTRWNMSWEYTYGYTSITDTIIYNGSIDYGGVDTILRVNYLPESIIGISVNKEGERYYFDTPIFHGSSMFYGKDSVFIWMSIKALGEGVEYNMSGKKHKDLLTAGMVKAW